MKNVEALQALYAALGGESADVANATTSVEVLNAIAAKYEGESDAVLNPEAIENIAAVAGNISPVNDWTFYFERKDHAWTNRNIAILSVESDGSVVIPETITGDIIIKTPVSEIIYPGFNEVHLAFTPAENYKGLYTSGGSKLDVVGDEITAGDGKTYDIFIPTMGSRICTKYDIDFSCNFVFSGT